MAHSLYSLGAKLKKEGRDRGEGFGDGIFGRRRLRRLGEEDDGADGWGWGVSGREWTRARAELGQQRAGLGPRQGVGKGVGRGVWSGPTGAAAVLLGYESRPG
jgi:hypothetical protein